MKYCILAAVLFLSLASAKNPFTIAELDALKQLRPLVSDALYRDFMQEDVYLIAWLRTTKLDPEKANQAIRKSLAWRKEKGMDTIVGEDWSKFEKEFPFTLDGHDLEGRPIVTLKFGNWDLRKAVVQGKSAKYNQYLDRMLELGTIKARQTFNDTISTATGVRNIPDWISIHDMKGYSLRQHGCLGCIPTILTYAGNMDLHYSYAKHATYCTNTPRIFESVVQLIRNLISERLNKIFKVIGADRKELMDHFSKLYAPDQLKILYKGIGL